ncbi:hypothetical protein CAL7716_081350 [Calothrix sp. PCC 7716]|nr:hypothetical protein CAL7716_081350 [Calothrix sp. PCC 7716]
MKTIIIRSVSIFAIPFGLAVLSNAFSSSVYAQSQEFPNTNTQQQNSFSNSACNSVPPARPTGGATSTRLQVLQQCYKNTPRGTIQSTAGVCDLPPARPTGGATLRRLEALQECYRKMSQGSK